jgi:molybdopterin molybdotransferase
VSVLVRLKGFQKLTPVDEALQIFLDALHIGKPKAVKVSLESALHRVLAEDVVAGGDLPRFDRSAVDGYAVRAEQTSGASQFKPRNFRLVAKKGIGSGEVKQLWTGQALPEGADAVVMLEYTKEQGGKVDVWSVLTPGENVSKRGEDVREGEMAVAAGTVLRPQHLGLIAGLGVAKVSVVEKPVVGVLATGNELVSLGSGLSESGIVDTNRLVLSALCCEAGAEPLDLGIARDDVSQISKKLKSGLSGADLVLTSGGTSVGGVDLVPEAVNRVGKPGVVVHGVAMRPGMPVALAVVKGKPVVVLPGNPVAAMVGFEVFVRPLIARMLGIVKPEARCTVMARMVRGVAVALGRRNFVRVRVYKRGEEFCAEPVSARGSGLLSTMTRSNGFVVVSEDREGLAKDELVLVQLFDAV